jgi:hypothetical protein
MKSNGVTMYGPNYEFTNNWFENTAKGVWDSLIPQINPHRILEVGSYEGPALATSLKNWRPSKA